MQLSKYMFECVRFQHYKLSAASFTSRMFSFTWSGLIPYPVSWRRIQYDYRNMHRTGITQNGPEVITFF
jgi:hypothetical protein